MDLREKPAAHCKLGSNEHQVPMPLMRRRQGVDLCIADIVAALNAGDIKTQASCCGHGQRDGYIRLMDGRRLVVEFPKGDNDE